MQRANGQQTLLAVFITAVAAFALGLAGADSLGWTTPETATVPTESATLPTGSLAEWSRPHPHSADLRPIIDAELNALLAKLDTILTSYAPRTVVLIFSGEWCGPCREEYPYQRFMLEHFKDDNVVLLGVNSDEDLEVVRTAKKEKGLAYRVWWDGHTEDPTGGPIATAWQVSAWPVIYVLDAEGVIRYASINKAEVVDAVDELVQDRKNREIQAELDKLPNPEAVRALK